MCCNSYCYQFIIRITINIIFTNENTLVQLFYQYLVYSDCIFNMLKITKKLLYSGNVKKEIFKRPTDLCIYIVGSVSYRKWSQNRKLTSHKTVLACPQSWHHFIHNCFHQLKHRVSRIINWWASSNHKLLPALAQMSDVINWKLWS